MSIIYSLRGFLLPLEIEGTKAESIKVPGILCNLSISKAGKKRHKRTK